MVAGASCTKGTGPEIDASAQPGDARGSGDARRSGDAGSAAHDAGPTDGAPGSDAMPAMQPR